MKTTKRHFEYFRERCEHWIKVLGLVGWAVDYHHDNKAGEVYAKVNADVNGRVASITLSNSWDIIPSVDFDMDEQLNRTALHECLELLLFPAKDRYCSRSVEDERTHAVIRTLEKVIHA